MLTGVYSQNFLLYVLKEVQKARLNILFYKIFYLTKRAYTFVSKKFCKLGFWTNSYKTVMAYILTKCMLKFV
jgi:hypothetical protein